MALPTEETIFICCYQSEVTKNNGYVGMWFGLLPYTAATSVINNRISLVALAQFSQVFLLQRHSFRYCHLYLQ
jgi:hypothetical protein